ncbi:MAG: DEAD/DEAH box helicase family protein [Lachnospiraceae bacterium]|nr:DEAD/DEAH box helicase family protein [Lachnospiraceae bacterium]
MENNKAANYYSEIESIDDFSVNENENSNIPPTLVDPDVAYVYSMREQGKVDLFYMSMISGLTRYELVDTLSGKCIFPDPVLFYNSGDMYESYVSREQLISGNIIKKLKLINYYDLHGKAGVFEASKKLLSANIPNIDGDDIHISLGASWIPAKYIVAFMKQLLDFLCPPQVNFQELIGKWQITCSFDPNYVKNNMSYGIPRKPAISIINDILNCHPVQVYDQVPKDDYSGYTSVLNRDLTMQAQAKEMLIREAWQDFIHSDSQIERDLQEEYLNHFGYPITKYDGSFLELKGLNPEVVPYEHQKNAIARIILNKNTLLAHEVGSGKTLEYICGIYELLRMELTHKAMFVVPNTTFSAVSSAIKYYYPDCPYKILAIDPKKDFKPAVRDEVLEDIKSDKYQIIVMAYSSFDMLGVSYKYRYKHKRREYDKAVEARNNAKTYNTKKGLESYVKKLKKELDKLRDDVTFKNTDCFDDLGIDVLVIDEAHNYKNISMDRYVGNIVGVHSTGSHKADSCLEKVRAVQEAEGHVIFATGTPITNSMADVYTLQTYLQSEELENCKIDSFNAWVNTFATREYSFEIDVDSVNYRFTSRFKRFYNIPELMSLFSGVCDFYQADGNELGIPDYEVFNTSVPRSGTQKLYIESLAARTDAIRKREVDLKEDNLLKITVDGRKCALDPRLVTDNCTDAYITKCSKCADNVFKIYALNPDCTQIVFCDISTPKRGFNIYDELKRELVERGIPTGEIAFAHTADTQAKRSRLERDFNAGKIKVLVGSTGKLGTGANVQERLIAVHHLDAPWRPSDLTQREGRILRQGNLNSKVQIHRYVTDSSFDAYSWQILENKVGFISQFLTGSLDATHREESDCAEMILDYAEIKALALGNNLIKERVLASNELEQAKIDQRGKRRELERVSEHLAALPGMIRNRENTIKCVKADADFYSRNKTSVSRDDRQSMGEELLYALLHNIANSERRTFDEYQGFKILLPENMSIEKPYIILKRFGVYMVRMDLEDGGKAAGVSKRMDNVLDNLEETIKMHEEKLRDYHLQRENANQILLAGNPYDEAVKRLTLKLNDIDKRLMESNNG